MERKIIFILVCFIQFYLIVSFAFAQVGNSSQYQVMTDTFSSGGEAEMNSSNFLGSMTVGSLQAGSGDINSLGYKAKDGFESIDRESSISITPGMQHIQLGILNSSFIASGSHFLQVHSNARTGYIIRVYGNTLTNDIGDEIAAIGDINQLALPGVEQFGINLVANTSPFIGDNPITRMGMVLAPYGTMNRFAYKNGDILAYSPTFSEDEYTVSYITNISKGTPAGSYQTTLMYTISSDF